MAEWALFLVAATATSLVLLYWFLESADHLKRLRRLPIRVHVNGIRGKSTVVRYTASALREGGFNVVAKTSGSATRLIRPDGEEQEIPRGGAPTILEQISVLRRHADPKTDAIVFECMAVRPDYQRVAEQRIVKSTLGVILNVRRDHLEELGDTIPEIARSLSETMPPGMPVLTAETNEEALDAMRDEAGRRGAELYEIDPDDVTEEEMNSLGPFAFRENVATALAIALALGVDRATAMRGIGKARPDPGASQAFEVELDQGRMHWVNLFGINDPESVEENVLKYLEWIDDEDPVLIALLNNRSDREDRARDFADWLSDTSSFDGVIIIGDLKDVIAGRLGERGFESSRIHSLEIDDDDTVSSLLEIVEERNGSGLVCLFGMANIHTGAASAVRTRFEQGKSLGGSGSADAD